jgi:hypothetical protein
MYLHHNTTHGQDFVIISHNQASDGGGIHADSAYVTLWESVTVSDNSASGYYGGGAVFLTRSVLSVPNTNLTLTMHNNRGTSGNVLVRFQMPTSIFTCTISFTCSRNPLHSVCTYTYGSCERAVYMCTSTVAIFKHTYT